MVNELEKNYTANNRIVFNICDELEKQGHKCIYVAINDYVNSEDTTIYDGRTIHLFSRNTSLALIRQQKNNSNKYLFYLAHPYSAWKMIKHKKKDYIQCLKSLDVLLNKKEIDCILFYYFPFFFTHEVLSKITTSRPIILYQMDPWGYHELFSKDTVKTRKLEEISMFQKANLIVTTPLLYSVYKSDPLYIPYLNKVIPLDFPNIKKYMHRPNSQTASANKYEIYFLGTIDDEFRDPKSFLDFVHTVIEKKHIDINIYFIGNASSKTLNDYSQSRSYIHLLESVDHDKYEEIISRHGHFLLNINNTVTNQMPSKIIDYISSGNPIINVVKNKNDYTFSLLEPYPLKYHFCEYDDNNIENFVAFLKESNNKQIDEKLIQKKYSHLTPEYVVRELLNGIDRITK